MSYKWTKADGCYTTNDVVVNFSKSQPSQPAIGDKQAKLQQKYGTWFFFNASRCLPSFLCSNVRHGTANESSNETRLGTCRHFHEIENSNFSHFIDFKWIFSNRLDLQEDAKINNTIFFFFFWTWTIFSRTSFYYIKFHIKIKNLLTFASGAADAKFSVTSTLISLAFYQNCNC